ncbi:MAG: MarR family transcriptional regulator [Candidatus Zixiibacteriota bacterium]
MTGRTIADLFERLTNLFGALDRGVAHAHGLKQVQLAALRYLARCNRYSDTPAAIAEYLGLTKGTVSQTIATLEAKGMLTRRSDAADGRVVHLGLTAQGRRIARTQLQRGALAAAADAMDEADATALEASLRELLRTTQRQNGGVSFGVCHSCHFFRREALGDRHQCGLTLEPLSDRESQLICREHQDIAEG